VVYLTDSDQEGEKYAADLRDAGVDPKRIFTLPSSRSSGLSIEDFVHKATLIEVANFLLQKLREHEGEPLREADVPNVGAAAAIEAWQEKRGIEPISKTAIAEHILRVCRANLAYVYWDPGEERALPLLRENRRLAMTQLHSRLRTALGIKDSVED
jgi:hypothetical protein